VPGAHRPIAEQGLPAILLADDGEAVKARIAPDRREEAADPALVAFQRLHDVAVAVEQEAGDAQLRILHARHAQDRDPSSAVKRLVAALT
jgi:hypothetical protein